MRARIDDDGLLLGTAEDGNGPEVPAGFDLPVGRYRWHADKGQWWPAMAEPDFEPEQAPDALVAIAAGFAAIRAGSALPKVTTDWLDYYARTLDARKTTRKGR